MYDQRYCAEQEAKYQTALNGLNITNSDVLDVGCGTGLFFNYVADNAGLVVGLDISRGLLLQANARAKQRENVFVVLGDADHLPFKDAFFSLVFAFTVLQNMPKPVETLQELSRTAKRESSIVATALKRAIPLDKFGEILEQAGLKATSLSDDPKLQCYVVVCDQDQK
jgi:ubiquinone/menaquinone biosynthesis C-methylase UbiE